MEMLRAQESGDAGAAWTAYRKLAEQRAGLKSARVTVGKGVLDPFLDRARDAYEDWQASTAGRPPGPAAGRRTACCTCRGSAT
ncbi:hypothetical protein ACR6C2_16125 [Streptomyces sp. INA 01156]